MPWNANFSRYLSVFLGGEFNLKVTPTLAPNSDDALSADLGENFTEHFPAGHISGTSPWGGCETQIFVAFDCACKL